MITDIKIFGERNSGTNFVSLLIDKNIINTNILSPYYKGGTGWKHGEPDLKLFKNIDNTLFVFIIRDLEPWLKSMYKTPYHLKINRDKNYEYEFKPIFTLDPSRNKLKGESGLGLAITRDIVRSHGGDIKLGKSKLGGLKSILQLPI